MQTEKQTSTSANELIDMAAQQSILESESSGGIGVVSKVNINFGSLKLHDSKKRIKNQSTMHENSNLVDQQMEQESHSNNEDGENYNP